MKNIKKLGNFDDIDFDKLRKIKLTPELIESLGEFSETVLDGDNEQLVQIKEIAPIEEWINSTYYLGVVAKDIFSYWKQVIIDFFNSPTKKNLGILYGCFTGDTKIPLLNGEVKTIKELSDKWNKDKEKFWVYSINNEGEVVPGLGYYARSTGIKPIYEVILDNGERIRCTGNHPFRMRKGSYKRADKLKYGDSLMPFYRRENKKGYEEIYDPKSNKYKKTHTIVNSFCHKKLKKHKNDVMVTHHKDYKKKNNSPSNLIWFERKSHIEFHCNKNKERWEYLKSNPKLLKSEGYDINKLDVLNHKVVSVKYVGEEETFNISIEKFHNFAIQTNDGTGVFVKNSLGGGKTFTSCIIIIRLIYELSCYNYPAKLYNLSSSTTIVIYLLAPTVDIAQKTAFGDMKKIIDQSPYFLEEYPRQNNINSQLIFDSGKVCVYCGSKAENFIGQNLLCLLMDEASFQRGNKDNTKFNKAANIFRESLNRRKSRFMVDGVDQSLGLIASSADTITSFTEQIIAENETNPNALIQRVKKYEVDPNESYSKENFWVFIGEKNHEPFIVNQESKSKYKNLLEYLNFSLEDIKFYLTELEKEVHLIELPESIKSMFEQPPIDYMENFKLNCLKSLGEVCGVAVQSSMRFFTNTNKFYSCVNKTLEHPFYKQHLIVSTKDYKTNELIENLKKTFIGKDNTNYYAHIDLSKTGDSTGLCIGHWDKKLKKCIIDLIIQIDPPESIHKIAYEKILDFIWYLKTERQFKFKQITFDQYQSEFFIQFFEKRRIKSFVLPDGDDSKYIFLRNKIINGEVEFYYYERFKFELENLIHYISKNKVDHPDQGGKYAKDGGYGKDVSDAVNSVVNVVFMNEGLIESNRENVLKQMASFNNQHHALEKYNDTIKRESKAAGLKKDQKFTNFKF